MELKAPTIDQSIGAEFLADVRKGQAALERVLGKAAARVDVTWEVGENNHLGVPTLRVHLSDFGVTRSHDFTKPEIRDDLYLRRTLRDFWDNVLSERIRLQLQKVAQSLTESESD